MQFDQNKLSELQKEILVQQNQIENLTRMLEEKRSQEVSKSREYEQGRLKQESVVIELQKQLKQEQYHKTEIKARLDSQTQQLEHSRL